MKKCLAALAAACFLLVTPGAVHAYQIDCAILICLSGGFPSSQPCVRAKAEVIRRVTPWPVEPPLQIWRCPMRVTYVPVAPGATLARIYEIAAERPSPAGPTVEIRKPAIASEVDALLQRIASGDYADGDRTADVDISGPEFDFVRSIRVYSVEHAIQRTNRDGDCVQSQRVRLGTYGVQGDFRWQSSSVLTLPLAVKGYDGWQGRNGALGCGSVRSRTVFIDWRDYEERYGFEQVNY